MMRNTMVIGASFFGLAYAIKNNDCIVIEERDTICPDFSASADNRNIDVNKVYNKETQNLREELIKRGLADEDGNLHILPTASVMAKLVKENNVDLRLNTRIAGIEKKDGYFHIRVFSVNGWEEFDVKNIINTKNNPADFEIKEEYKKYISAFVINGYEEFKNRENEGIFVKPGLYGESVLSVEVCKNSDYIQARKKLDDVISKYIKTSDIASFAAEFSYRFDSINIDVKIDDNYFWTPSSSYSNLLDAFEGGIVYDLQNNC